MQGQDQANNSGRVVEETLKAVLEAQGWQVRRQCPMGRGIYGQQITVDLYIPDMPLIVESKWQDRRGSADEKFPFLVENIRRCYPCPVIVVVDGAGARDGAVRWLKAQVDGTKLKAVLNMREFMGWVMRLEIKPPSRIKQLLLGGEL